ncbi:MAG: hypothetical protein ABL935_08040 [Nitrospiraceae bacterium]|nr:hypothetical protein [Nitrospira sp.]
MRQVHSAASVLILSMLLLLPGCTSTLVRDDVKRTAGLDGHCAGSEWADNSSLAVLPVPVVAFFVPHFDLHKVASEPYLSRCGASTRVVNREVSVNTTACIPTGLTRIITLGVWQWCPAHVSWSADVLADGPRPAGLQADDVSKPKL